jgi:hypothetical protein
MLGVRRDDPNDTVRHEDRRELRGLRVAAAFINYTDARRGNFLDSFVPDSPEPGSAGHLVHYLLDYSSALGAGNVDWKDPKLGNEYRVDPAKILGRAMTLWLVEPAWARLPLKHPALGYFESSIFDPEGWKPSYLNPVLDRATLRDTFWGAKLVASLSDADLRVMVQTAQWSDPRVDELLTAALVDRRQRIARAYFNWLRINPIDRFEVHGSTLRFDDLAVSSGVVDASVARYRFRAPRGEWVVVSEPRVPLSQPTSRTVLEIETSHEVGERWSPPTRVVLAPAAGTLQAAEVERATR